MKRGTLLDVKMAVFIDSLSIQTTILHHSISPDGEWFLTGGGVVRRLIQWDAHSNTQLREWIAHDGFVCI